jgi:nucleotide-binding universal stress UspA family protein
MGSRGYGTIQSMLVGSVSAEVVDQAIAPVLLARSPTISKVVLAWDGSACARIAAQVLRTWSIFADCAVRVVSVADIQAPWWAGLPGQGPDRAPTVYLDAAEESRRVHRSYATEMADELRAAGLHAEGHQRDGDAAAELIAAAKEMDADLIVMGTRGRTGLTRLVLGSVARNVVNHAECSVLIARDAGEGSNCAPAAS